MYDRRQKWDLNNMQKLPSITGIFTKEFETQAPATQNAVCKLGICPWHSVVWDTVLAELGEKTDYDRLVSASLAEDWLVCMEVPLQL